MSQPYWTNTAEKLPPDNCRCRVITAGGDERTLIYKRNLWWTHDMKMYVYFVPGYWREQGTEEAVL